jgi:dephospho-CoA kinase
MTTTQLEARRSRFNQMIHETPLIQSAIDQNAVGSLTGRLVGMFQLRDELLALPPTDTEAKSELKFLEETIGRVVVYLAEWRGIDQPNKHLFQMGIVTSRGDLLRIAAPIYDFLDRDETESAAVPLIGVVGQIASGKGTIGELISDKYSGYHLPLSDRLRELADSEGEPAPHSRDALRRINNAIKPRFGNPVFVRWTIKMAKRLATSYNWGIISTDGFRSLEETEYFKAQGGILIAVTASFETRYQRMLERNRGADDFSREAFERSDAIEQEWINPIIGIADVVFSNEGSIEELEKKTAEYLESL